MDEKKASPAYPQTKRRFLQRDDRENQQRHSSLNQRGRRSSSCSISFDGYGYNAKKILRPENIRVLNSINAHRLLRWLVTTVTNQAVVEKIDARRIFVPGGYQELARIVGAGAGRKAAVQIRDILLWQAAPQQFVITDPETGQQEVLKEGNLLTFNYTPRGFKKPSIARNYNWHNVDDALFI